MVPMEIHESATTTLVPAATARNPGRSEEALVQHLHQALLVMPPALRTVFLLRENGGLTYQEITRLRRCSVETVKSRMRAAIYQLRLVLEESTVPGNASDEPRTSG